MCRGKKIRHILAREDVMSLQNTTLLMTELLSSKGLSNPRITRPLLCQSPLYKQLRRLIRRWHQHIFNNISFQGLIRQQNGFNGIPRSPRKRVLPDWALLSHQPTWRCLVSVTPGFSGQLPKWATHHHDIVWEKPLLIAGMP